MANGDPVKRELYKRYTGTRKKVGYKTPTYFQE